MIGHNDMLKIMVKYLDRILSHFAPVDISKINWFRIEFKKKRKNIKNRILGFLKVLKDIERV